MFRKVAVFAVTMMIAGTLFAEGQKPSQPTVRNMMAESNDPGGLQGEYRPSPLDRLNTNGANYVYTGRLPDKFKVIGLTDEQTAKIEALCKEARDTMQEMGKQVRETYKQTRDPKVYQEYGTKVQELAKQYDDKIMDALTDEQKAALKKIDELIKEQQDKSNEIYQEAHKKVAELKKQYDEKLGGLLTPEQKKILDDMMNPKPVPQVQGGEGKPVGDVVAF